MSFPILLALCILTQLSVVGTVYFLLTSAGRRPGLVRGLGLFLFCGLEIAILLHITLARRGHELKTGNFLTDIALAALIALAFGFGSSLLKLLNRSRNALVQSENLSSTLFDQSSEPVILLDHSGRPLDINSAACDYLGYSREESLTLTVPDVVHPDDASGMMYQLSTMVCGDIARARVRVRRKDGIWMETETSTRRLDNGTFLTLARDITSQARQQRMLERFAEISSGSGDRFFTAVARSLSETLGLEHVLVGELLPGRTDRVRTLALMLDGELTAAVEYDLAGTPCGAIVGKTMACYPSHLREFFPDAAMLAQIGAVSYVGTPLWAFDGSPLGILCALSRKPIADPQYCQTVLSCYSRRVESEIERMRTEAALRESEERYSNVVNVSPIGMHMYRLEADGRLILEAANPAADWLLGLDHSKLLGRTIEDAFPSLAHTEIPEQYRRVAVHGERWRNESVTYKGNKIDGAFEVVAFQRSPRKMAAVFMNITDRKKAEEALRESEAGLANAQRITHIGNWTVDPVTNASFWSTEMYRMCGMSPKDKPPTFFEYLDSFVHPDDRDMVRTAMSGLLKGRSHQPLDYRIILPDGSVRVCQVQSTVDCDSAGRPVRISGTTQDITERKHAEETLHRQNDFLVALQESALDLVSESDLDTLLRSVLSRACQFLGTESGYIDLLETGADHLTPGIALGCLDQDHLKFAVRKGEGITGTAWETGEPVVVNDYDTWPGRIPGCELNTLGAMVAVPLVAKSGVVGVIGLAHQKSSPCTFDEESVIRLVEFARFAAMAIERARLHDALRSELTARQTEIGVREQVESELQRSLSLLRATLESTADGILVVDRQGGIAGYNRKFLELWRIPITLAERKDDANLIAFVLDQLKDPDGFVRKVTDLYASPLAESYDHLEFKDGRHFERYSIPQRAGDEVIGRVWCFRDITDRKRAEKERARLEEQLLLSQKLETIGTLAAGIAHDFNNLLVPVIGYTELADSELTDEDPRHLHLAEVLKAAYRAKSLVGQILAFSRQQPTDSKQLHLESVVQESAALLRSTLEPNISLETRFDPDLPPLFADITQLHQVIMNLGVNSSHAMKSGGKLSISVRATSSASANCLVCGCQLFGTHLELCVADTGHGMDQATLRRVFDPFFTTKPVGEGTGLGLAVTHGIVSRHGGHICVQSEVGHGTEVYIYLPAVETLDHCTLTAATGCDVVAVQSPLA
ncbi:hypothetical protein C3F09_08070 [candidate division GN15 bacterium]|uniref:histidine kinase n=1 Tax=candidate division GN15 bacterium TaxID=2072418 RepID=A0A855X2V1_9BACT|nr:MAG: hypothetical protein C3F09_08070 [candidate division GN15 bacterium]